MWKPFVLLLACPAPALAEEPVARIKGEKAVRVVKGQVFTLDAGESKSEEDLQWTATPEVGFILGTPASGSPKRSILIVNGELTAPKYTFTVKARGRAADGVMTTKEASVEATVSVDPAEPGPAAVAIPVAATPVTRPIARIEGPDHIRPGTELILDGRASRSDPAQPLIWAVDRPLPVDLITQDGGTAGAMISARNVPAGEYVFTLVARGTPDQETGKSPLPAAAHHTVRVSESPAESPCPAKPEPTPPCLSGPVSVLLVADSTRFDQQLKAYELATKIKPSERLFGFRLYTDNSAALLQAQPAFRYYLEGFCDTNGKRWPKLDGIMVIIQGEGGRVISTGKAPESDQALLRKIRDLRL